MTVRLGLIAWTAGPLSRHTPIPGDATRLVRPYVLTHMEPARLPELETP